MNKLIVMLIVASLALCVHLAHADDQAAPATQPAFQGSPVAQQAAVRYEAQKQLAAKRLEESMDEARRQYIAALKRAQTEQVRKHNTDLAAEMGKTIDQLEADAAAFKKKAADAKAAAAAAAATPTELAISLDGRVKMDFVLVQPGSFIMGSKNIQDALPHKVTITRPFYMGKYSVTQEQWQTVMGANPSYFQDPKRPTVNINWNDCQDFITKINQKLTGQKVALPTEAQWEYACRAGSQSEYCFGDDEATLGDYAWYAANDGKQTHPVGTKKPNAWGLYDMQGNAWNWCQDWYGPYSSAPAVDPTGPASGTQKVLRGGSWYDSALFLRCSHRIFCSPGYNRDLGAYDCRLVLETVQ